jgi:hypothetical protein
VFPKRGLLSQPIFLNFANHRSDEEKRIFANLKKSSNGNENSSMIFQAGLS